MDDRSIAARFEWAKKELCENPDQKVPDLQKRMKERFGYTLATKVLYELKDRAGRGELKPGPASEEEVAEYRRMLDKQGGPAVPPRGH